jgi:glycosyltransferase involved in cell wall biosynthesis
MADKRPNIYAHCSYIGTSGYNNHTRNFFRALSDYFKIKVRNFTIGTSWTGLNNTPHDTEPYLDKLDKELLIEHTVWTANKQLEDHQIYSEYGEILEHDINIVLNETHHHYFYQDYNGPKIAYNVWETTRQPEEFFNKLKDYDQVWVASSWQRDCTIEQGIAPEKVKVVPEAVNGEVFKPDSKASLPDYEDGRFKFVIFGRWDYRKSTKEIIQSFLAEFGKDEPVDLIVSIDNKFARDGLENTEARLKEYKLEDPRIKIIHFPTDQEYVKYLQKGHVFLSCARSEGWNLPLIEAMACGTPSIYSECSGQLEFAKGRGLPVKIKNTLPAKFGEYSSFSQHMMSGEFYEPDFDHLRTVMRDAYINYDTHKEVALKQSKEIREQFTWDNAAQIAGQEILSLYSNLPKNSTQISFEYGPKVEVKGYHRKPYFVEFVDSRNNQVIHSDTIYNNRWTRCNKKFYIPWIIRINGKEVHKFDLTGKKVKISFDSKSVGDTLAWMPQVLEFKNKQNCKVAVSTFHNNWFKNLEVYKDLEFVEPDIPYPAYAHYKIGWFKDGDRWDDGNKNPYSGKYCSFNSNHYRYLRFAV